MSNQSVFCIASCRNLAELIVDQLKVNGFSNRSISVLYPDEEKNARKNHHFGYDLKGAQNEGALTGVASGSLIGGTLGWIAGIGAYAVPGVGAFIAAGSIFSSLSAAAVGAAVGGIAGGLVGLGIPELEARRYEGRVKLGNILISVDTHTLEEATQAKFIFTRARALDICVIDEAFLPDHHRIPAMA